MQIIKYAGLLTLTLSINQFEYTATAQSITLEKESRNPINSTLNVSDQNLLELSYKNVKKSNDLLCLALNIYFEARGESERGQYAVGHVVMNRVKNARFPNTVCKVVRQGGEHRLHRCQFSWWCDGQSDKPRNLISWHKSIRIARKIYSGNSPDLTQGALWYHADYVNPYWQSGFLRGPKIGKHIFYKITRQA